MVERYQERILGYCTMMLGARAEEEDAAQEVFIKAYQALNQFRGNASFSTWIYRITANHCTDILRKKTRQKTESWEALLEDQGERIEALFTATPAKEPSSEAVELLAKLLAHLPEKSREVIILREIQGLSYEELSKALDCSLDAVKSRLKRTRQELINKWRHFLKAGSV